MICPAGAAGAGLYALANGASFEDTITAASTGAALGGISAAIGYGIGTAASRLFGTDVALQNGASEIWKSRVVNSAGRVLSSGLASGVRTRIMGGSFDEGFRLGISAGVTAIAWESVFRYFATGVRPRLLGADYDKHISQPEDDSVNCVGRQECLDTNWVGSNGQAGGALKPTSEFSWRLSQIPGFNSFAYLHDNLPEVHTFAGVYNITTMVPAFIVNYSALRGMPDPDTSYLSLYEMEHISRGAR